MSLNLSNASMQDMIIHCENIVRATLHRVIEFYPPLLNGFVNDLKTRIDNVKTDVESNAKNKLTVLIKKEKIDQTIQNDIPSNSESLQLTKGDHPNICLDVDHVDSNEIKSTDNQIPLNSINTEDQNVQDKINCETRAIGDNHTMVSEEGNTLNDDTIPSKQAISVVAENFNEIDELLDELLDNEMNQVAREQSSNDNIWPKPNDTIETSLKSLPTPNQSMLSSHETIDKETANSEVPKIIPLNETIQKRKENAKEYSHDISHKRRGTIIERENIKNGSKMTRRAKNNRSSQK